MNNMTQEQKAKAYDEARKKIAIRFGSNVADEIFSQFEMSEDERIRKEIITHIKWCKDVGYCTKEEMTRWVAWIEEQANHANFRNKIQIGDKVTKNEDGVLVNLSQLKRVAKKDEKQGKQSKNEDKGILHRFSFYSYKDEPNILYLAGLYVDDEYRNKGIGTKILKVANEVAASMKCNSIRLKTEKGSHAEKLYRENGYTTILEEENQIWLEKQGEQKPAWSEEDEMFVHGLIRGLAAKRDIHGHTTFSSDCIDITKTIDWLESLKDRVQLQPQSHWKPTEEQMNALNDVISSRDIKYDVLSELWKDLKKLMEGVRI